MNSPNHRHETAELSVRADQSFITTSNCLRIVRTLDYSLQAKDLEDLYKKKLWHILSTPELALLSIFKEACEKSDLVFEAYQRIEARPDTKRWVWEGGVPSYHSSSSCEKLNSDYINWEIPPEIQARGDVEIVKFRKFFSENRALLETDEPKFITRLDAQFALKNPPRSIFSDNSGAKGIDNINLKDLEDRIDLLLVDAEKFRNSDESTKSKIDRQGYGTHRLKEAKEPGSVLHTWHNDYKKELKKQLCHYFRIKFNRELGFSGMLLESLGFKRCAHCHD